MELTRVISLTLSIILLSHYYEVTALKRNSTTILLERYPYLLNRTSGTLIRAVDYLNLNHIYAPNNSYLDAKSALSHLYDIELAMSFENPIINDMSYSNRNDLKLSAHPVANQSLCRNQLEWIINETKNTSKLFYRPGLKSLRLTEYLDSFGRPEAATFMGNTKWLGSYKECMNTRLVQESSTYEIQTRYCIGKMRPTVWDQFDGVNITRPRINIRVGICLPESCDTSSYELYGNQIEQILKINFVSEQRSIYKLEGLYCLPDERSPLRQLNQSAYIYIGVVCGWLVFIIIGSILFEIRKYIKGISLNEKTSDLHDENLVKHDLDLHEASRISTIGFDSILEAISIRRNIKWFISPILNPHRVNLIPMDSFKVLCSVLVVMGHTYYLSMVIYNVSMFKVYQFSQAKISLGVSIPLVVDTFFTFGGFVTTYIIMKKFSLASLAKPITWFVINFHIFLRLSPVYLLIYWYSRVLGVYTGSGPQWDYGTYNMSFKYLCQHEEWWKSIIYLGSFTEYPTSLCVVTSWFLVAYAQCSLVIPAFTYILFSMSKNWQRITVTATLCLMSSVWATYSFYNQTSVDFESFSTYGPVLVNLLQKFEPNEYTNAVHRIRAVLIGCLGGYYLYQYDRGFIMKWPWWMRKITLKIALLFHLIIIFSPLFPYYRYRYFKITVTKYQIVYGQAALNLVWPCLNVVLLLRCVTDLYHKSILVRFAGHKFWHICNKLTFALYMIHFEVINYAITSYQDGTNKSDELSILKDFCFVLVFTLAISLLLYLLFESPINSLVRLIMIASSKTQKNCAVSPMLRSNQITLGNSSQQQTAQKYVRSSKEIIPTCCTSLPEPGENVTLPSEKVSISEEQHIDSPVSNFVVHPKRSHRRSPTLSINDIKLNDLE